MMRAPVVVPALAEKLAAYLTIDLGRRVYQGEALRYALEKALEGR